MTNMMKLVLALLCLSLLALLEPVATQDEGEEGEIAPDERRPVPPGQAGQPGPAPTRPPYTTTTTTTEAPPPLKNGTYAIVMPRMVRPGQDFAVSINLLNGGQMNGVTVEMSLSDTEGEWTRTQETTIAAGQMDAVVTLTPPMMIDTAKVNFVVRGSDGDMFTFHNSTELDVKRKTMSIFVQADKAMYKPGATLKFRVMGVTPDLMPYMGSYNISIFDSKGNKLKQWLNQANEQTQGVVTKSYPLSDEVPLGDWYIQVDTHEHVKRKTFAIAEYVLPKYEVTVNVPSFIVTETPSIMGTVNAKYTFGKPVKGKALIRISMPARSYETPGGTATLEKVLEKGKADFEIAFQRLIDMVPYSRWRSQPPTEDQSKNNMKYRDLLIEVNVTEELTDIVLSKNATIPVKPDPILIEFMDISADTYKPGLDYTSFIKVSRADGTPPMPRDLVWPNGTAKMLQVDFSMNQPRNYSPPYEVSGYYTRPKVVSEEFTVPPTGVVMVTRRIDPEATGMSISAAFAGVRRSSGVSKFNSRDEEGIQVSLINSDGTIKANQAVTLMVKSTVPIRSFFIQILSKGVLVSSDLVTAANGPSDELMHTIPVNARLAQVLAPSGRIVVYYMTNMGEFISDSLDFNVEGAFANDVSLSFNTNQTEPAEPLSLTVNAYPQSFVGVLAVDQSVLLLGGDGNDIKQADVLEDLRSYDSNGKFDNDIIYPMMRGRKKRSFMPWWPVSMGGSSSQKVMENAGLELLTDAFLWAPAPPKFMYGPMPRGAPMQGARGAPMPGARGAPAPLGAQAEDGMAEMAGFGGASGTSANTGLQEVERVRTEFPETWLWTERSVGDDGSVTINTKAPDTITSWVASAFAMSSVKGLGIAENTAKMTVFKPFFVTLNLPYSIIRHEEFALQALVFNYLAQDLEVLVTLKKSDAFALRKQDDQENLVFSEVQARIMVPAGDGASVKFWIVPQQLGLINIEVMAQSTAAADGLKRTLLVEPEGVAEEYCTNVLVDMKETDEEFVQWMPMPLPDNVVPDSVKMLAMIIGDVMGPALSGLESLIKMPYGCGEQNMLNFAPNIFVMQYLTATGQLTSELESRSIGYMEKGYSRELNYQHTDGSFSAFGDRDPSGSTWLTAFVIKSFYQAKDWVDLDDNKVISGVLWMIEQQAEDGHFVEPGRVIHTDMQGGSSKGIPMTAYVLIAMLELQDMEGLGSDGIGTAITKAVQYLEENLGNIQSDSYALALTSYALTLAGSAESQTALNYLNALAIEKDGEKYWTKTDPFNPDKVDDDDWIVFKPPQPQAAASSIEMTAYILMTYTYKGMITEGVPIMKWLVNQRNGYGGYSSTQDTVMGLQALARFATHVAAPGNLDMDVRLMIQGQVFNFEKMTHVNAMVLQIKDLSAERSDNVRIFASGKGLALAQVCMKYHVFETPVPPTIEMFVSARDFRGKILVDSCAVWTGLEQSGMMVLNVRPLSGYTPTNVDELIGKVEGLKRVEQGEDSLIFYIDELTQKRLCVDLEYEREIEVANIQEAQVSAYQYYNPKNKETKMYRPAALEALTMCSFLNCDTGAPSGDGVLRFLDEAPVEGGGQGGPDGWVPPAGSTTRRTPNVNNEITGGATCPTPMILLYLTLLSIIVMVTRQ